MRKDRQYPAWVCLQCGNKYGRKANVYATWHHGKCDVCGVETVVTEPRDFGHLVPDWIKHAVVLDTPWNVDWDYLSP